MRNLLAFAAAALLTFVGVGWYLDWYHIRTTPLTSTGHQNVNIDINGEKIGKDLHKGEEKAQQILEKKLQDRTAAQADAPKGDSLPSIPLSQPRAPVSQGDTRLPAGIFTP